MRLTALAIIACMALFVSGCAHSSKTADVDATTECASECAMTKEECSAMKEKGDCASKKACCASEAAPE